MAPSPRKPTPSPFKQTWDETDAAFLDPTSLPIARLPRGWERKQETKVTTKGKQKKVWRRYTTRSRASDASPEDDDEEEHDSRARAVKKLQRMSPEAMEKSASMRHGRQRAFKATRWDRRKSVLPRKRTPVAPAVDGAEDANESNDEARDADNADLSNNTFSEVDLLGMGDAAPISDLVPEGCDRRATFTFSVEGQPGDNEIAALPVADDPPEHNATVIQLHSPTNNAFLLGRGHATDNVDYPELPRSPKAEARITDSPAEGQQGDLQAEGISEDDVSDTIIVVRSAKSHLSPAKEEPPTREVQEEVHNEESVALQTSSVEVTDVSYPSLPAAISSVESQEPAASLEDQTTNETEPAVEVPESRPEDGDSDMELDGHDDQDGSPDEEFTEASLQLNIQRQLEMELEVKQSEAQDMPEQQEVLATYSAVRSEDVVLADEVNDLFSQEVQDTERCEKVEPRPIETEKPEDDIAAGLTLSFSVPLSQEPTPRKLRSPSPPAVEQGPEDATMTIALEDDTAILKDFLFRAAASKASKVTTTHRRESVQNRRDSDVIRHALASPRKVLEDKDPNSPSKYDNDVTLDLSQTLTLTPDLQGPGSPTQDQSEAEGAEDSKGARSRRSSRTRKSRLPAPSSAQPAGPPKIAVRRADGGEPIVLKKSDAQELSLLTRANTRKNKQGAFAVNVRLLKLANDAAGRSEDSTVEAVQVPGKKYVRWDEQLAYYQEDTVTLTNTLAEAESLATPDELSLPTPVSTPSAKSKSKVPKDKNSTPKIRRVRGLGTTNGTPGKGLLQPGLLLPESVQEEREAAQAQAHPQRLPKPKSSKLKKMPVSSSSTATPTSTAMAVSSYSKLPTLDVAPVGVEPTHLSTIFSTTATTTFMSKERKFRLATPKKVKLPQPTSTVPVEGKENQQRTGLAAATPKKGIPMPSGTIPPSAGGETGLPRRRTRKM
ncbi:hypothetical protein K458DRAFT_399526 [Lentithecium fluviatile CBS 122367]|uniref:Uncharacterized protein n=1 Tax=Lentithecium fluviatile CBS 122367 TaxID=1168545 RepID=A0A6G1JJ27_9PLEO|nr:hypothetical protein K458DRAFT_399526 [Lentithecium fluviatile CBS 122367]